MSTILSFASLPVEGVWVLPVVLVGAFVLLPPVLVAAEAPLPVVPAAFVPLGSVGSGSSPVGSVGVPLGSPIAEEPGSSDVPAEESGVLSGLSPPQAISPVHSSAAAKQIARMRRREVRFMGIHSFLF